MPSAVFADCSSSPGLYNYCRDHFHQLDQNFELRIIDDKETKEDQSNENLPTFDNDLFNKHDGLSGSIVGSSIVNNNPKILGKL